MMMVKISEKEEYSAAVMSTEIEKVVGVELRMSMCGKCEEQEEKGKDDRRTCKDDDVKGLCCYSSGSGNDVGNDDLNCDLSSNRCSDCTNKRKTMGGKVQSRRNRMFGCSNMLNGSMGLWGTFRWIFLLVLLSDKGK